MRMVALVNFQDELKKRTDEIESVIASYLPVEEGFAKTMAEAMNYSVLAGGKRLRPMFRTIRYGDDPYPLSGS